MRSDIRKFFDFGGVRLEDNLIITDTGIENLTDVPIQIRDIENNMNR
jgi:Xaa-Pro dipeptidase